MVNDARSVGLGGTPADASGRLTDIAHLGGSRIGGTLDRVGMTGIEVPVRLRDPSSGASLLAPARAEAFVGLDDPDARGIHMSRLYLALQAMLAEDELGFTVIRRILQSFLGSHVGTSSTAMVRVAFDHLVKRQALASANAAWRSYPVSIGGEVLAAGEGVSAVPGGIRFTLGVSIAYSSTCPCSTALARQLTSERFHDDFSGRGSIPSAEVAAWLESERSLVAVPHSQRSHARIDVAVTDPDHAPGFVELVDLCERALGTPVQAAVKREDEQEFARLNAANLMFCEDAGRRLKAALEGDRRISDYRIEVAHVESLHPHDAVAVVAKGIPRGFRA